MLERLESMISMFTRITTGVLFVTTVFIQTFWGDDFTFGVEVLWQILMLSLVCAIGTVIILPLRKMGSGEISKHAVLLRFVLQYLFINVVVLSLGFYFEWYDTGNFQQILGMVIAIAFVFVAVTVISYLASYQTARKMNQKLRERGKNR